MRDDVREPLQPGDTDRLAFVLKALSHPVRLEIVSMLVAAARSGIPDIEWGDTGEVCVCRINQRFELSAPALSHHLSVLRHAGLVETRRDGTRILYRFNEAVARDAVGALALLAGLDDSALPLPRL